MTSIIEGFAALNSELSKLEQTKPASAAQPDMSNSGDITEEARKSYYAMYGYPIGVDAGGVSNDAVAFVDGRSMSIKEAIEIYKSKAHKSFRFIDWSDYEAGC
ncbi:hypothetical protein [Bradyrhizobium elkanii]|uniref:hypothetical protein n=1 Tax=Bradyrhizobium elkanii TaxID=29448 RepID=UPI00272BBA7F|nr:hypothetical protein [Bradyrhizobium elkanii]WLA80323.1 hypothetical protein QNJ99_33800 [Bradyrhizobium elkanii]